MSLIASMSAGWPYRWTGMMPFVLGEIAASTCSGSRHQVAGSTSTNTGSAPTYRTALAVAMYVMDGTMTSSPGATSSATSARWSATVPLATVMTERDSQNSANSRSNRSTYLPVDEIHELRMASTT